ncbi:MAG: alginate O-acetyltransferase AlgF [Pseudomonadota bacterium]
MKRTLPFYAIAVLGFSASAGFATDASLYAEAPPEDASFVRFVGFDGAETAEFSGKTFALNADEMFAYAPVSAAALQNVAPGGYFTVVRNDAGDAHVISEAPRAAASKVSLYLINATDDALELKLADGSVTVIDAVDPMQSGLRAVNPIAISLGVFRHGEDAPVATFDVSLRRGQNVSVLADPGSVRLVEHRFGAVVK